MEEQRSMEWFRARLGKWNGSEVGDLMGAPRTKGKQWTDKALTLINKVDQERHISDWVLSDDSLFDEYLKRVDISNKAMKWGTDHEDEAVEAYRRYMEYKGCPVEILQTGSVQHPQLASFHASPDRILHIGRMSAVLEIKCPYNPATFYEAKKTVTDWESLKAWNARYYWQVTSEIAVTGSECAHFVLYDPHADEQLHVVKLMRDEEAELQLLNKILEAEDYINNINK